MTTTSCYPIGQAGQPWGEAERSQWQARQRRQRSYADDVLTPLDLLVAQRPHWEALSYGEVTYGAARYPLRALRSRQWQAGRPCVLVTGGVHGYETSGVLGVLACAQLLGAAYGQRLNLMLVPCVSPWAYEHVQRWNFDAVDPNRAFRPDSPAQESAALMRLVAAQGVAWAAHVDLHETTDSDEAEFRPALAARDGKPFVPCVIPDGFYLVDDSANPQPAFQQALLQAVAQVTPIAPADEHGCLIGTPLAAQGVIGYPLLELGLCASVTGARYTSTTEVYPDSAATSPRQCVRAQVAAVQAALDFVLAAG